MRKWERDVCLLGKRDEEAESERERERERDRMYACVHACKFVGARAYVDGVGVVLLLHQHVLVLVVQHHLCEKEEKAGSLVFKRS